MELFDPVLLQAVGIGHHLGLGSAVAVAHLRLVAGLAGDDGDAAEPVELVPTWPISVATYLS
jgi:hypothetical protein